MDTEIRLAKVEVEVESCTSAISDLRQEMDRRFTEQQQQIDRRFSEQKEEMDRRFAETNQTIADLRVEMDRRFAAQDAAIADLRKEMRSQFKWLMGTFLSTFTVLLGLIGRIAGLY